MLPEKDRVRILDMLDHAGEVLGFAEGKSRSDLDELRWLNLSLVRLLEIIGEAASRVSDRTRDAYPAVQWRQIIALRNRLIHGYNQVDLDILWDIVSEDIPRLASDLESIVRNR